MINRRKPMNMTVPTASMGDIAFLLIIFFMLVGNFMKSVNVVSEDPVSPDLETQEAPQVSVVYDREGKVWLQGVEISVGELAGGVQVALGNRHDLPVHVRIDKNKTSAEFLPVIEALSEAGMRILLVGNQEDSH